MFKLTWIPEVLRAAGLDVLEVPGWQTNGHREMGDVRGVLCHHTCGPLHGDIADLDVLVHGRTGADALGGPLCNLGLGRSGTYRMVAAGQGWHAGAGGWYGITNGNACLIGIEAENTGETTGPRADTWPKVQMDAYALGCAALLDHIAAPVNMCVGHKEWAPHRKDDPDFDMNTFRAAVGEYMGRQTPNIPKPMTAITKVDGVNVRLSASASSMIVGVLAKSTPITIESQTTNGPTLWYKIDKGWVASQLISLT